MGTLHHIHEHPEYRCYLDPPDEEQAEIDASLALLEKEGPPPVTSEESPVGNSVCYECKHRVDRRPWWKRILFTSDASHYGCFLFKRQETRDPITGHRAFLEKISGMLGPQWVLTSQEIRSCTEINPDGHCKFFKPRLVEKKDEKELG